MKVASDPNSPHYVASLIGYNDILLDGVPQRFVTFADEEEGFIIRHKCDDRGELVLNGDYIVHEKVEGRVEIVDKRKPC